MGFRDLKCFNQALLAKQIWRLVEKPNYSLNSVLKVRYYKHDSILDARRDFDPCFSWGSMWATKPLLHEGLGWIIGDGYTFWVKKDRWLLCDGTFVAPVLRNENDMDYRVCEFID